MFNSSHISKTLRYTVPYRPFCSPPEPKADVKISELKEKLFSVSKELKDLGVDASIEFKCHKVDMATKNEIEREQLKKIGKAVLATGVITGFGLLCAAGGAFGLIVYAFTSR